MPWLTLRNFFFFWISNLRMCSNWMRDIISGICVTCSRGWACCQYSSCLGRWTTPMMIGKAHTPSFEASCQGQELGRVLLDWTWATYYLVSLVIRSQTSSVNKSNSYVKKHPGLITFRSKVQGLSQQPYFSVS